MNIASLKDKRSRSCFTKEQLDIMSAWIKDHANYPYPTDSEKREISKQTGLHPKQVAIWFTNTRKVRKSCNYL